MVILFLEIPYIGKVGGRKSILLQKIVKGQNIIKLLVREGKTLEIELFVLESINDHYPKFILTLDIDPEIDYNGIRKLNVLDWSLEE